MDSSTKEAEQPKQKDLFNNDKWTFNAEPSPKINKSGKIDEE